MKILFVYSIDDAFSPSRPLRIHEEMQFGISYISSYLKARGHNTSLVVLSRMLGRRNERSIDNAMNMGRPDLICFTAVTSEYAFIRRMAAYIKARYPGSYRMIGGAHISLNPDEADWGVFDALCIGEGEEAVFEAVGQIGMGLKPSAIPNLWIRDGDGVIRNKPRPFLQDIDTLPFPDRDMWLEWVDSAAGSNYPILLGRGCPFQCTYCCNHALRKIAEGQYVRLRSPENIVKEIDQVARRWPGARSFYLEVETIAADKEWAMRLCSALERLNKSYDNNLSFGTNLRITPNPDLEGLFAAFSKSNFKYIKIGVESGSEKVRREVMKRAYSNQDIIDTASLARRYGLEISFYNLIGVPGEKESDFKETISINRKCLPDQAFAHIFFPYPGTELYSVCEKQGLIRKGADNSLERCKATLDIPGFSRRAIQNGFVWFDYNVYRGYRPMGRILAKVLISKLRSDPLLHYVYRRITYSNIIRKFRPVSRKTL